MIGIAFSLGFTVGPLLGAYFAISSKTTGNIFYQTPALLALAFSLGDLLFIWLMLPETLTVDVKVGYEIVFLLYVCVCVCDGLQTFLSAMLFGGVLEMSLKSVGNINQVFISRFYSEGTNKIQ